MDNVVLFIRDPITGELQVALPPGNVGAVATFRGVVRGQADDGRAVSALVYEAYESLAASQIETIVREAVERFGVRDVSVTHRLGEVLPGETSVVVTVAAAHRAQALHACEYVIDELKVRAAIWKQERYADGSADWKACDRHVEPAT